MTPPPFGHHWSLCDPRTLVMGCNVPVLCLVTCIAFQSTHPCRVRRIGSWRSFATSKFQSTHPCGCTSFGSCFDVIPTPFQSTHPCGVRRKVMKDFANLHLIRNKWLNHHFNPRTHKDEHGSTFLHYCGLIGSHVVPIAHSVLSGLDNGPLLKRERSRV